MFLWFQICFWFDKPVSPSFQIVESGIHCEIVVRDPKHVPKCDISYEMGWPAWWNVWKYVRSSRGWSIKPDSFQFISWKPHRLSKYRKMCIYWRHTHCFSAVCWRSGINVGEQNLIHVLENSCMQWHMVVNLTKTKVLVFNEQLVNGDNRYFIFNKNKVPSSNIYSYLGVIFSNANYRFGENYVMRTSTAKYYVRYTAIGPDVAHVHTHTTLHTHTHTPHTTHPPPTVLLKYLILQSNQLYITAARCVMIAKWNVCWSPYKVYIKSVPLGVKSWYQT